MSGTKISKASDHERLCPSESQDPGTYAVLLCKPAMGVFRTRMGAYPQPAADQRSFRKAIRGHDPVEPWTDTRCENRPLVDNREASSLFVNPSQVHDDQREPLAQALNRYFGIDVSTARDILNDTSSTHRVLINEMSDTDLNNFGLIPKIATTRA